MRCGGTITRLKRRRPGTKGGDHVEYALPLGVLGEIAHAVMVKRQLEAIFRFRQREIRNLLGAETVEVVAPVITI